MTLVFAPQSKTDFADEDSRSPLASQTNGEIMSSFPPTEPAAIACVCALGLEFIVSDCIIKAGFWDDAGERRGGHGIL